MAAKETKRTKPVTKRVAKSDAPAKPRTRRLTKSLAPVELPEPATAPAESVPLPAPVANELVEFVPAPAPVAIEPAVVAPVAIEPAVVAPVAVEPAVVAPAAITPEPAPLREPFAPVVRSTGGSRRALDTGAGAWVSVVYEGGATFCDDVAGVFVHGTRTRLRAPIAERLLTLDGFRMP